MTLSSYLFSLSLKKKSLYSLQYVLHRTNCFMAFVFSISLFYLYNKKQEKKKQVEVVAHDSIPHVLVMSLHFCHALLQLFPALLIKSL